jgi:hypothetical protein
MNDAGELTPEEEEAMGAAYDAFAMFLRVVPQSFRDRPTPEQHEVFLVLLVMVLQSRGVKQ